MKNAILVGIGIYFGYLEFRNALDYWLPAWGAAFDSGYVWGQTVILAILAAAVFGSVISLGYRFLGSVLD